MHGSLWQLRPTSCGSLDQLLLHQWLARVLDWRLGQVSCGLRGDGPEAAARPFDQIRSAHPDALSLRPVMQVRALVFCQYCITSVPFPIFQKYNSDFQDA
jgi:hypothetical protein